MNTKYLKMTFGTKFNVGVVLIKSGEQLESGLNQINVSNQSSGIYFIRIHNEEYSETKSLMIK